tara:strand:+ start:514 stop:1212 length:699 start_codon:yes stop_codon:yes gene_type:complete
MGFKMKGFNPGKGTSMGSAFTKTWIDEFGIKHSDKHMSKSESADYKEKMRRQKELENIKDPPVVSYDEQKDRPLYQRDYMNVQGRADLPGTYYQSPSSWSSYGSKKFRDHSKHEAYSGVKDRAAGYDEYSLGAKGPGDEFAPDWVKKRNAELRIEAVYNTREANAIGRYKTLETHYGKGNVPESRIPEILKDRNPEWVKDRQYQGMTGKERRQAIRKERKRKRQIRKAERRG